MRFRLLDAGVGQADPLKPTPAEPMAALPEESPSQSLLRAMKEAASASDQMAAASGMSRKDADGMRKRAVASAQSNLQISERKTDTAAQGEDLIAGMEPVQEHNTYRAKDGIEYFVSRSSDGKQKLLPYRPSAVKAARFAQGDDGNVYPFGSDGEPLKPVPDGVKVSLNPSKPTPFKDNLGNTFVMDGNEAKLLIPAKAKLDSQQRDDYMTSLGKAHDALTDLQGAQKALEEKGARGLSNWFGASKGDVQEKQAAWEKAAAKVKTFQETFPELRAAVAPASEESAAAPEQSAPVKVETAEQFAALPSGSIFIDPKGVKRRKP